MAHPSQTPFHPQATTLEDEAARVEPLAPSHARDLLDAGRDPAIWRHLARGPFVSERDVNGWIATAQAVARTGDELPFAIIDARDGRAVGSTRYMAIRRAHRTIEIGWTWLTPRVHRTAINTTCKLLLLRHAFEKLGAVRVEFKTDIENLRSQRAIERLGAKREGVFRNHMIRPDGSLRASVYFSIVRDEWPDVECRLVTFLDR